MKIEDLAGKRFGYLTVIEREASRANRAYWRCECDCGKIISVSGTRLRQGQESCGCVRSLKSPVLKPGQKYGRLTLLQVSDKKASNGSTLWDCLCDCGEMVSVRRDALIVGKTKSCGCLRREQNLKNIHHDPENLEGMRSGYLTALYYDDKMSEIRKRTSWVCQCDCGQYISVPAHVLKARRVISCGCAKRSAGEIIIEQILQENQLSYQREYTFADLKNKGALRFDFAVFTPEHELVCLIEFDGIQHFMEVDDYFSSETLAERQARDHIKNQYCLKNNIPLFRIHYTQLSSLCSIYDILNIQNLYKGD